MNKYMKTWEQFNENLPSYNQYSKKETPKCPSCGENENIEYLAPKDYIRKENGDYERESVFKCKNCDENFIIS